VNVSVRPVCLLHGIHGCVEIGTLVHIIFGYLTLPVVIDTLLVVLAAHTFLLMWFVVMCEPPPPPHMLLTIQPHFSFSAAASISSTLVSCKEAPLSSANRDEVKLMYLWLPEGINMIEWCLWRVYLIIKEI
jgi:hypothetical protein